MLYIFTIKIFLKNTLLCLNSQNKERRRQETQNKKENTKEVTNIQNKIEEGQILDVWASFKADFDYSGMIQGRFWLVSAILVRFGHFGRWPLRPDSANMARFWPNRHKSKLSA